jgi:hypothetical protein
MEVRKSRYYEVLPFELACSLAGVSESEIVDVILTAVGETPDLIETNRLFSLLGLIAIKLSHDEALEALSYGLDLFNTVLEDKDGDGAWTDGLSPPTDIRESVAGYIWSALAAPEAVLRWEAAHAVLELCTLGRHDVLAYLMKLAAAKIGGPFVDARLHFYWLHALQWLLIGLARAASKNSRGLAPHATQLIDWALKNQPHVLIRQMASRAILQLIDSGDLADEEGLRDRLKGINKSHLPVVETKTYQRKIGRRSQESAEDDDDRFYFGIDFGPYWCDPLGRVFALSQSAIEADARDVIRNDFVSTATGRWDEDERARRKLYEEQHTYHSHGSYPRTDTLHFYLAYHAMMIVAGRLLANTSTHRDPEYGKEDEFAQWLSRHDLSRADGRWLWDRRDPRPFERGRWLDREKDDSDRRMITQQDLDEALYSGAMLNLWGYWTEADTRREQSTHIRSALVTPDRSEALLRALTTANAHDYSIPSADGDLEIDEAGFELKGWVSDHSEERRLDENDRWAGGISFPPPRPAAFVVELTNIGTDADERLWKDSHQTCIMETQVWGYYDEAKRHEGGNPDRGSRLQASVPFITSMLDKLNRDLIIEIQIERHRRYQPYESFEKDDDERIPTRAKLYLLGKD